VKITCPYPLLSKVQTLFQGSDSCHSQLSLVLLCKRVTFLVHVAFFQALAEEGSPENRSLLHAFHLDEQTLAKKNYSIRWSISIYIMQPSCLESLLAKLCSEPHRELDEPEEEEEDVVEEEVVEEESPVVVYRPPTPPPAPLESRLDRLRSDIRKSSRPWAIAEAFAVSLPVTNDVLHGIGGINDEADSLVVSPSKESTESEGKHPSGEVIFEENKEEGDSEHAQPIQALSSVSSISARPVPTEGWARRKSALSRLSVVVIPKDPRQTPTLVKAVPEDQ